LLLSGLNFIELYSMKHFLWLCILPNITLSIVIFTNMNLVLTINYNSVEVIKDGCYLLKLLSTIVFILCRQLGIYPHLNIIMTGWMILYYVTMEQLVSCNFSPVIGKTCDIIVIIFLVK
jgi:hypothetical protein